MIDSIRSILREKSVLHDASTTHEESKGSFPLNQVFRIYPNPSRGEVTLQIDSSTIKHGDEFIVRNSIGETVRKDIIQLDRSIIVLDLSSESTGFYLVSLLRDGTEIGTQVFILNR